jgi:hypothetical protein
MELSFKRFIEEEEQGNYFNGIELELGIRPEIYKKILKSDPQIAAQLNFGNIGYKLAPFEILDIKTDEEGNIIGCLIKMRQDIQNQKGILGGNQLTDVPDEEKKWVDKEELLKLLTQGWGPAVQSQAAAPGGIA